MHLLINVSAAHELTLQKAANRYMRIMIGSITHELRTPLNSSTNALTLLEDFMLPGGLRHLKTAKTSNRLLSALVEDILDLTRLEAGEFRLAMMPFQVRAIVELIDELFRFQIMTKRLQLVLDVEADVLELQLHSDQRRLEQVLLNLMSNAIKFTFRGSITFRVKASGDTGLTFEVEDTGVGISAANLPNLFKLFGRLQESEAINTTGCGIGLHISQQIIGKLGGQIVVHSQQNEGSVFSFELPNCLDAGNEEPDDLGSFSDDELMTSNREINSSPLLRTRTLLASKKRQSVMPPVRYEEEKIEMRAAEADQHVMIVDDHPMNVDVLEQLLVHKLGKNVITCLSGQQAIDALLEKCSERSGRRLRFLILMDINMPVMDGVETTHHIRAILEDESMMSAKIVAFSVQDESFIRQRNIFDDFRTKPMNLDELALLLAKYDFEKHRISLKEI